MKCLRCGEEMKQYEWINHFTVYGREYKPGPNRPISQEPHSPHSIFECENCGYCELSTKLCKEPDL